MVILRQPRSSSHFFLLSWRKGKQFVQANQGGPARCPRRSVCYRGIVAKALVVVAWTLRLLRVRCIGATLELRGLGWFYWNTYLLYPLSGASTRPVRFLLLSHTGSWHAGGASGTDGCALAKLGSWTRIRWQETLYGCRLAQPLCGCLARDAWRGPAVVHQEAGQVCV